MMVVVVHAWVVVAIVARILFTLLFRLSHSLAICEVSVGITITTIHSLYHINCMHYWSGNTERM